MQLFDLSKDVGEEEDMANARVDVEAQVVRYVGEAQVPDPRWSVR